VVLLILAALGLLLHLGLTAAERRGLVFYRNRPRPYLPGPFESVFQPSVEYLVEEQASGEARADRPGSGEQGGPEPGE
jgi:hypothetical protein